MDFDLVSQLVLQNSSLDTITSYKFILDDFKKKR